MKTDQPDLEEQLKASEDAIARHLDALQEEVQRTGQDVREYVKRKPWVGVTACLVAGVAVGLLLGKRRGGSAGHDFVGGYVDRLADIGRQAGVSESQMASLLREAVRESLPPLHDYKASAHGSGVMGKIFGVASGLAVDMAKRSIMGFLEERLSARGASKNDRTEDDVRPTGR